MSLCLTPKIEAITSATTGRLRALFAGDVEARARDLRDAIAGKRVLVAGGAGSIGSATIREILVHRPKAVAVLDPSENALAELVRMIRSDARTFAGDLAVEPLPYGSALATGWLAEQPTFDVVLSFAALKHVRSERDRFSLLRMLDVNLVEADRFLAAVRAGGHGRDGVFFVSTDKAANPVSLMGASKRAMESLLWAHAAHSAPRSLLDGGSARPLPQTTAARFANVAFSDGSLPWGFLQRLEKGHPLAAPADVRRYLISPTEAGQLCLLAAFACPHLHALVPKLDPAKDLVRFTDIAAATLRAHGLEPAWYDDDDAARRAVADERARGRWPVVTTVSDTNGEKEVEEFVGVGETSVEVGLASAAAVVASAFDDAALEQLVHLVDDACRGGALPDKDAIVASISAVATALKHRETGRSLDGKM